MQDRSAIFGVASAWACLWACLGLLRAAGFELAWDGPASPPPDPAGPLFQVPALASRLLGLAQLGVAGAFLAALLPGRAASPEDRMLGACAWAMIVLGVATAADSMTLSFTGLALDAVLFVALAGTALLAATADHRAARLGGSSLFGWARRDVPPAADPLAEKAGLDDYRVPCRTSSQT